ncbi:hypothetical protein CHS0354_030627 [Potamilus streckersoni]|uniref:Uncharacterized protein n=1 Tax=Potamilus streckersoni TaxID=2493646 RepID=A0AAE0VTI5_9BIVA|nr:hypothetical protein CHS0354_030627 [Potamilus streckersoni]
MRTCMIFSLIYVLICAYTAKSEVTKVSLDGPDSICSGNALEIEEGNELQLVSKGIIQKSMCSVRINVHRSENCRGVCFNLRSSNFVDCSAKLITTEIHFGELVPDVIKEENCKESMEVPWCSSAHTLKLDLVVDDMVMTPKYNFSATVYPRCGDDVVYKPPNRVHFEEGLKMNLVHGIVVGVCLCLMFAVIIIIIVCYYRNHTNLRNLSPSKSNEKTLKISGEIAKQSSSSDQKGTYKKINEREKEEAKLMLTANVKS